MAPHYDALGVLDLLQLSKDGELRLRVTMRWTFVNPLVFLSSFTCCCVISTASGEQRIDKVSKVVLWFYFIVYASSFGPSRPRMVSLGSALRCVGCSSSDSGSQMVSPRLHVTTCSVLLVLLGLLPYKGA